MLKRAIQSFFAGAGFCAGAMAVLFLINRFWPDDLFRGPVPVEVDEVSDVRVTNHRPVRLTENFMVSGELEFDDFEKYERVYVRVLLFEDNQYLLDCIRSIGVSQNPDYFTVECDARSATIPIDVSYEVFVEGGLLAVE